MTGDAGNPHWCAGWSSTPQGQIYNPLPPRFKTHTKMAVQRADPAAWGNTEVLLRRRKDRTAQADRDAPLRSLQNKNVVCILDEANLLDNETLEEFRFFLNTKIGSKSPMALLLWARHSPARTSSGYRDMRRYARGSTGAVPFRIWIVQRRRNTSFLTSYNQ